MQHNALARDDERMNELAEKKKLSGRLKRQMNYWSNASSGKPKLMNWKGKQKMLSRNSNLRQRLNLKHSTI